MTAIGGVGTDRGQLDGAVHAIRRRWRRKHALRGAALAVVAGFAVLVVASYLLRWGRYSDGALVSLRMSLAGALALLAWRLVVRPLRAQRPDHQVALYAEEQERTLDGALVTAVDMSRAVVPTRSPVLASRVVRAAIDGLWRADVAIDLRTVRSSGMLLGAAVVIAAVATWFGPQAVRDGARLLLVPVGGDAAGVYAIGVQPRDATVARGGDQLISATLRGFESERVELLVRDPDATSWTRLAMAIDSTGTYSFRLFDIVGRTEYAVEATGVRSPTYTLSVADLPYVKRLDLEYRFPAYTQLPPQQVDSTGDIAALKGTLVRVRVTPTAATNGGRLLIDGGDTLALVPDSRGSLIALLRVDRPGFYKIELQGPGGRMLTGSLDYTIDVLPDRKPTVTFVKPGRDAKALAVDEVFTEVRAQDDYGVSRLDLVYSINGAAEKSVPLSGATARAIRDIAAGHTFMLEDMNLVPGDVISYYARARDNNTVSGAQEAVSDIYFLQVRPYASDYRQQQGGPPPDQGQPQENPGQLSRQQRDIIAGTFNQARDSAALEARTLAGNLAIVRLAQQKLREQVNELGKRLVERGIAKDSLWKKIADIMPKAAAEMDSAGRTLAGGSPRAALQPEQRALQQLQRAEAVFRDIQVQMQGRQQAGAGGGGGADAQDLADIFEMQRDKLRNQYESARRGQDSAARQQQDAQVDAVREKLRQLAARRQQEDERLRRKADSLGHIGQAGSSSGAAQRQMADDAEQAARQLERLARERQSQPLADAAQRLHDASDAMRKAAANGRRGAGESRTTQQRLDEARRLLDLEKAGQVRRDVADAQQSARDLAEQERRIAEELKGLGTGDAAARQQLRQSLSARKNAMLDSLRSLTQRLDRAALQHGRAAPRTARAMGEAADTLRSRRMEDRVQASQGGLRTVPQQQLEAFEQTIGDGLGDLEQRLQRAAAEAQGEGAQARGESHVLDRMRDLVRGVESMDERARQQAQHRAGQLRDQAGQQTANAQRGQRGPQGRQGPEGQGQEQQGQALGRGENPNAQGGGMGSAGPGAQAGGDGRQFSREMAERVADARALRDELGRQGIDVAPLDRAMQGMRNAGRDGAFDDGANAAALRARIIEGLKAYEFALRRALGEANGGTVLLGRTGEVPARFRSQVEEYYKAIARPAKAGNP